MKTITKSISILSLAFFVTLIACTDLSEDPYSTLIDEDLGDSPEVLAALAAPAYTSLATVMFGWTGFFDLQEECSDVIVTPARPNGWVDGGVYRAMHMHTWNSFQGHASALWSSVYGALNVVNASLIKYKTLEGTENNINELRALRALYYYLLLDNFGNVPVVTEEDAVKKDFLPEQKSRAEVFRFVESELLAVIDNLAETKVYGRMNKWAAKMVLAKIYLNAEVYTGTARWDDGIKQVNDIIASGLYQLEPNYHTNFAVRNETSREQIFSIVFDATKAGWFHYPWKTLHPSSGATYNFAEQPWGGSCAIPQFIDTYDADDDRAAIWIKGPQVDSEGAPIYNSMDPALAKVQLNYSKEVNSVDETQEYEGYRIGKFEIEKGVSGTAISDDVPLFRYADALMIKAECLLRKGLADDAAVIVTEVRRRAFLANPAKATVTGADLMKGSVYNYGKYEGGKMITVEGGNMIVYGRFLDELGYEFAAEFHRRQDLIRFDVFTKRSWFSHVPNGDHRIIFDIPQSVLDANPKLKHNPGYL